MLQTLRQEKLVAIVRGVASTRADDTAQALYDGGVRLLEVTLNSPDALAVLARWRERFEGRARVGAGTVLDVAMARDAIAAGAEFLVAPGLDEAVIACGCEQGVAVWPGALTPTEVVRAWQAGAEAVKLFPCGGLGAHYLKELRGPLPQIPLIAVGGVNLQNAREFLQAGAVAIGVGGALADRALIEAGRLDEVTALAARFVAAVQTPVQTPLQQSSATRQPDEDEAER